MKKKVLSMALAATLVVGLCPGAALAANSDGASLGAASAGSVISAQATSQPAKGTKFTYRGSTYKVLSLEQSKGTDVTKEATVELVKYGGSWKKIDDIDSDSNLKYKVWSPSYKGYQYRVTTIGENAFNNAKGKAVTELEFPYFVTSVKKNALKNMTSLTYLWIHSQSSKAFASGCFNNTGKNKGKALEVDLGYTGKSQKKAVALEKQVKTDLVKKGLSKNATVISMYETGGWRIYTTPSPTVSSIASASKAFTAKWAKQSGSLKYQVRYSTKSNMSGAKTVSASKGATSKKVTGLKGSTKYYVQVRVQMKMGDKKLHWSEWSDAKTVTTKK